MSLRAGQLASGASAAHWALWALLDLRCRVSASLRPSPDMGTWKLVGFPARLQVIRKSGAGGRTSSDFNPSISIRTIPNPTTPRVVISIRLPRHSIWDLTPHDCLGLAHDLLTTALDLPSAALHCPKLVGASSPLPRHRVERHMHPSAVNADAWPTHLTTPTPFRSGRHDAVRATLHLQTAGWLAAVPFACQQS